MLLLLLSQAQAGVRINEIVYQVAGGDSGFEWVELCSTDAASVDLTGYTLEIAGSSWNDVLTFGSAAIAPGTYPVAGAAAYATISGSFSSDMENAGSYLDGVRLKDAGGVVVDTVLYGQSGSATNNYNLLDDSGSTDPLRAAPVAPEGESIGRLGCADTDNSAVDFVLLPAISPGAENSAVIDTGGGGDSGGGGDTGVIDTGGGSGPDCSARGVRINEFFANPAGSDDGFEWVELYNSGGADADVSGWTLLWDTSSFDSASDYVLPAGTVVPSRGWLILGAGGLDAGLGLGNGTDGDGLRLQCGASVVDTVIYGGVNGAGFPDDSGSTATSIAPEVDEAFSIVRKEEGVDTDQSGVDFISCDEPSPGAANLCVIVPCTLTDEVVINEFSQETDAEFVELKNVSGGDVDLSGYLVQWATSASSGYNHTITLPDQVILPPGGYYVIGTPVADNSHLDLQADMDLGNATSNADAIRLMCDDGAEHVLDTVIYAASGKTNDDAWPGDDGAAATSLAPTADDGQAVGRIPDGQDTDQCGVDFLVEPAPTPGAENATDIVPPGECVPGAAVYVNEVLFNTAGEDDTDEWVELYNAGDTTVNLGGYMIEAAKSSWGLQYTIGGDVELAPGEFFVIGAGNVEEADVTAEDLDLGDGTGTDGVRLVDCAGAVLDTMLYGDEAEEEITGDGGSTDRLSAVDEGISVGRYPDGTDSDTVEDWVYYFAPSPGAPNAAPPEGKETCIPSGCQRCPDATGAERGCTVADTAPLGALPLGGWEIALGALALIRRRG